MYNSKLRTLRELTENLSEVLANEKTPNAILLEADIIHHEEAERLR